MCAMQFFLLRDFEVCTGALGKKVYRKHHAQVQCLGVLQVLYVYRIVSDGVVITGAIFVIYERKAEDSRQVVTREKRYFT